MPIKPASIEDANSISMLRTLGITLLEIGERHAVMMVTVDTRHSNYFGGAHGGLLATLIDTASFFPLPLLPSGRSCTTTNLNVHYLHPARMGDCLEARSELLHLGSRTANARVEIRNQFNTLIAHGVVALLLT